MPKLPPLSGPEIVCALERLGFLKVGQSGSHVKLRRASVTCIVPLHREVKKGTLAAILRQAELTLDDLLNGLAQ